MRHHRHTSDENHHWSPANVHSESDLTDNELAHKREVDVEAVRRKVWLLSQLKISRMNYTINFVEKPPKLDD